MNIFSKLPIDVVYIILEYINLTKLRNGKPMFQITKCDPRIRMLVEKYRQINYKCNPNFVLRFLNKNHYIRSSYFLTLRTNSPYGCYHSGICIKIVKCDRFKNGNVKQKGQTEKYSHVIMDSN